MTRQLTVTLETVTPMFLAGADQDKPELRPPSVRGQLRYWLRAALGALVGDNLETLKRAEAEVFGDTGGTGAVQIKRVRWLSKIPVPIEEPALPHHQERKHQAWMKGFPAGEKFELVLTQHIKDDTTWLAAISSLLLMASYGGLGRRCRRGWGTVKALKFDTSNSQMDQRWSEALTSAPLNLNTTNAFAEETLPEFCQKLGISVKELDKPTSFIVNSPNWRKIFISDNNRQLWNDYKSTIVYFGKKEHLWLQANPSLVKSVGYTQPNRQASPLWLRVLPVKRKGEVKYILLATLFNVDFPDSNYEALQDFLVNHAGFSEVPQ